MNERIAMVRALAAAGDMTAAKLLQDLVGAPEAPAAHGGLASGMARQKRKDAKKHAAAVARREEKRAEAQRRHELTVAYQRVARVPAVVTTLVPGAHLGRVALHLRIVRSWQ